MKNSELHDLVDLVTAANYFFEKNDLSASIRMYIGRFDNGVHVFEINENGEAKGKFYHSTRFIALEDYEFDPKFIKARAHIKRLLDVGT